MKTIYHICIYITLLASTLFTTASCEDWLEVKSPTSRPTVDFFQTPVQAEQALLGIYNGLLPVPEYILLMSDGRSDDVWTEPACLLYTSPSPRDAHESRMPSSA